ncbi:hypothetical protein Agabi119p4_9572 [Agaricus bisporus var. burnettii]|uniref:Uncharacterized protein n=1 Tax=Agaricus bisporus var. burnettii TaxID=192524 RepID=A0A8H7C412_AGABI|nr:hypothetical protein Agabi119p4_9572 [Agaricus bisporus var. burnettii]
MTMSLDGGLAQWGQSNLAPNTAPPRSQTASQQPSAHNQCTPQPVLRVPPAQSPLLTSPTQTQASCSQLQVLPRTASPVTPPQSLPNDSELQAQHFYYPVPPARYMPGAFDPAAPRFDGEPRSLEHYLDEIELLGQECGLRSQELIRHAVRYLDGTERELWKGYASTMSGGDWLDFKEGIMSLYPGSSDHDWYRVTNLENLVENQAAVPMCDLLQFGKYYRHFITIADFLLDKEVISQREYSKLFLDGFHIDFRNQLEVHLNSLHPPDQFWTVIEIKQVAECILPMVRTRIPLAFPTINLQSSTQPSYPYRPAPPEPTQLYQSAEPIQPAQPSQSYQPAPVAPASGETFDMSSTQQFLTSGTFPKMFSEKLTEKLAASSPTEHVSESQPEQNQLPYPQSSTGCRACSNPTHLIRYCPKVRDYIHQGRCIRDKANRICLPNGTLVTPRLATGKDILERVDNWHQAHPTVSVL